MPRGNSNCLMDYANGLELYKGKYWDYVHEPTTIIGVLEGDDEGAQAVTNEAWINSMLNRLIKSAKDDSIVVFVALECKEHAALDFYLKGFHFNYMYINIPKPSNKPYTYLHVKGKVRKVIKSYYDNITFQTKALSTLMIDDKVEIRVPDDRIDVLKAVIEGNLSSRNLLIFANGYRPNPPTLSENPKDDDVV